MARSVPDLVADRAMLIVDQLYFVWVFLGILLPATIVGLWTGTWQGFASGLLWGGLVRICLMQHVTWSINSVCHVWGARPFHNADHSTNNFPIAVLSLGEGWHNNHHAFPTSARHGLRWWQFDSSWLIILAMKSAGLAWDVRTPTENAMLAKQAGSLVGAASVE
jgi:stearoyl-CoA desaturase (delta-9 desaturase)